MDINLINNLKNRIITYGKDVPETFLNLVKVISEFFEDDKLIENMFSSNVRFYDYYSSEIFGKDMTDYFRDNFKGKNMSEEYKNFIFYALVKTLLTIDEGIDVIGYDYVLECLPNALPTLTYLTETLSLVLDREKEQEKDFKFLDRDNKYKIFFSGYSYDDISLLPTYVLKALTNKLYDPLSITDNILNAEAISHTKDKYRVPLLRMHVADDYRIAFIRREGATIVVGVELKSGKDTDYTRYDNVARKINDVYDELHLFFGNQLNDDSVHNQTVSYIKDKLMLDTTITKK